ncbi:LysR family transcriptional regulator [Albidovulum sediminis]|uniref:LysR family transcriptional regulator n=1 Tax=Albidovulum sediminis TaxID=3066345 RepID=A0ABT2NME3_9RHOB|nr:LysR family transcriptional regulator [Defluviimonas sediminis]MCT8328685.1 LysR family transcriptional regulator [Defluviimonas sediminis]
MQGLDLGALDLIAAVVRTGSLTRAAARLGMSQPAVSYRLRRIEAGLGSALFDRSADGCTLTPSGAILWRAIEPGLSAIDAAVAEIGAAKGARVLRILTDFAFAGFWLMPRLGRFRLDRPGLQVQIVASQAPGLPRPDEVVVRFGRAATMPEGARLLMPERVVPVAAPMSAGARRGPGAAPLIHLDAEAGAEWLTWAGWFAARGAAMPGPEGSGTERSGAGDIRLNTYDLVVQAALDGQGVALGWRPLVDAHLAAGRLVAAGGETETPATGYWLIAGPGPAAAEFAGWLAVAVAETDGQAREAAQRERTDEDGH